MTNPLLQQRMFDIAGRTDPGIAIGECSRLLQVSPRVIRRWTWQGLLPHWRTVGNHRRFSRGFIERVLEEAAHGKDE